jgi:exodeoxyribonuclease-5
MQESAVASIKQWFKNSSKQTFFLAGYAGTGKSTLVHYVIDKLGIRRSRVEYACYTGKAALVLTQKAKGKFKAQTIHRLIYKIDTDAKGGLKFIKKRKDELAHIKLIVIDEWSMVDSKILEDLKSFGVKLLLIGDQGQLPPVSSSNNKEIEELRNNPDFSLTEIHRQAEGNPIIHLSMLARTKQPINYGWYGTNKEVLVVSQMQWQSIKQSCYTTADQIICGYNRTRQRLNQDIRSYMGFTNDLPQVGDKLICAQNNWSKNIEDISLVNGITGFIKKIKYDVTKDYDVTRDAMEIQFRPDFTDDYFRELYLVNDHFTGKDYKLLPHEHSIYSKFDFGYAITCHKSQGSQWENVVVISEVIDRETHHRWLYTAITRSSKKMVLVI